MKKVVVIGPESTGKSTLSEQLASCYQTAWVHEYARDYLTPSQNIYTEADLLHIAKGQVALEETIAASATGMLICDTDLYVMKVWSEHSYGRCHKWILEQIAVRKYDFYILTDIDMAWTPDPLREHGEAHMRNYFFKQYLDILINSNVPWVKVSGNELQRLQQAQNALKHLAA